MVTILNTIAILSAIILFFTLISRPAWSHYALTLTSLTTTSIIVGGLYPALDEILLSVMSFTSLITIVKSKKTLNIPELTRVEKFRIIFISYLIVNTATSALIDFEKSNLRFLLLFVNIFILAITLPMLPQETEKTSLVCQIAIKINLYLWIGYWVFLRIFQIDWATQQSVSWAGTAYAAIVPSIGLVLLSFIGPRSGVLKLPKGYLLYYCLSTFASIFYDSRVLNFVIILVTILLCVRLRSTKSIVILFLAFIISQSTASAIVSGELSLNSNSLGPIFKISGYVSSMVESAQFINNPRTSDQDRSSQIRCSTRILLTESHPPQAIFGYGQNMHKKVLFACLPDKLQILNAGAPVRPVGFAAFIIDFGLFGVFGLIFLIVYMARETLRNKSGKYFVLVLFMLVSFSLVTNYLDHSLVYQILFLDLLRNLSRCEDNRSPRRLSEDT